MHIVFYPVLFSLHQKVHIYATNKPFYDVCVKLFDGISKRKMEFKRVKHMEEQYSEGV